jgi:hypothetical protein
VLFCPRTARAEKRVSAREIVRKLPGAWTGPGSARKLEIARSWDIEVQVRAISSVVERLLHTQEVAGSNPASRTILDCPGWRETCRVGATFSLSEGWLSVASSVCRQGWRAPPRTRQFYESILQFAPFATNWISPGAPSASENGRSFVTFTFPSLR